MTDPDVLLIGESGQLGRALRAVAGVGRLSAPPLTRVDLLCPDSLRAAVQSLRPRWIINAAAYTDVDGAEAEPALAFAVNAEGPAALAELAREFGARLVHISTDYVFDGRQGRPYTTHDGPAPLNVYGRSKLAGEQRVQTILGEQALIMRTAWLYAAAGRNFLQTVLNRLAAGQTLRVVADQIGSPTHAAGLARALLRAMELELTGLQHWTDAGVASWYDFAVAIREEAIALGLLDEAAGVLSAIPSAEFVRPAQRPTYSVLDKTETWHRLGITPPHWRVALRTCLGQCTAPRRDHS